MKTKLPIFAALLPALAAGIAWGAFQNQSDTGSTAATDSAPTTYASSSDERIARGAAVLQAAIQSIERHDSVSARLRQQIHLFGHSLAGPGLYLQQGHGPQRRFRWEMSIQTAEGSSTISRVSDGRFLWLYDHFRDQPQLAYVDLRRVREELAADLGDRNPVETLSERGLSVGGLPRMLAELQANFHFVPVNETYLGNVEVWELHGVWKPEALARRSPEQARSTADARQHDLRQLPAYLPHEVVLYVGKQEHFPYRFEYHRLNSEEDGPRTLPLVTAELFEVRLNGPLDSSQFGKPANLPEVDQTRPYLQRLGLLRDD